jgi:hypothetical protein
VSSSDSVSSSSSSQIQQSSSTSSAVVSSSSSASLISSSQAQPSLEEIISMKGQTITLKGLVHGLREDGFFLYFSSGYAFIKNPVTANGLHRRILNAVSTTPQEGDYVQVQGNVSVDNGYLEIDVPVASNITIITTEDPSYTIPLPKTMSAMELAKYLQDTYIEWASGGSGDQGGKKTAIPFIKEEISCTELRVFKKNENGLCSALGPGLVYHDFYATFLDNGYALETAPYQLSFYVMEFGTTTCTLSLTGAKKLTPEYTYSTIDGLKTNPVQGAHYKIEGEIMGDAYGNYVVDDGTGRILVSDLHLAGNYGEADQEVGKKVSIDGVLCKTSFQPHYEFMSYAFSSTLLHTPEVSLNNMLSGFSTDDYSLATNGSAPYWIGQRFTCTLTYKSGGKPDDPILRCYYEHYFCVIINYDAMKSVSASFTFQGYMVYGYSNTVSLLYDGHSEA